VAAKYSLLTFFYGKDSFTFAIALFVMFADELLICFAMELLCNLNRTKLKGGLPPEGRGHNSGSRNLKS
jgi:hypothetical protein